ncbi:MAG: HAD-IIIC family phosphatase [Lachnospiraceae bacterium]|nr:HAD-IIIC family phosphatase [Lachnospiraceae bacterium]
MCSFRDLQKLSRKEVAGPGVKIAVLGNCSTQFLSQAINGAVKNRGFNASVFDADYNQIEAQLLDRESELFAFEPDFIVLWLSTEKLYEEFLDEDAGKRPSFAERYMAKILRYWELAGKNSKAKILQFNFTETEDKCLGNYSVKVTSSFSYQIRKLNFILEESMAENANVFPVDILSLQIRLGRDKFGDAPLYYNAKMTVSINSLPYIAKEVAGIIAATKGSIKKCVIMDLDNTLWGGVIGDDGLGGIEIGELGQGHCFSNLQRWLKQLKQCGIILAVCSKNNEETAKEPFEKHEDMILKLEDISVFVANWEDKASNIKLIQKTLNIGMDSIVFLDDNPFERNLVREMIPEITVPELPEDPALYLDFLQKENLFENIAFCGESADRTKQYRAEFERKKAELSYESIDEYLKSLKMVGRAREFEEVRFQRIAELTQRSNQFNLRTVRYTKGDIERISKDDSYITLYYTLKDKFGDHGLVSVVILKKIDETSVFVDTWLMSCRVLKRGMEEFIVNTLVDRVKEKGFKLIEAQYIPTPKNKMVEHIYDRMGFTPVGEGNYRLNVEDYIYKPNFIETE